MLVESVLEVMQFVRIGLIAQNRCAIVIGKGLRDGFRVVHEVKHEHVVFLRVCPVEPRERLHSLDAGERLVHIHGMEQWLIVTRLELVGADQKAVRVLLNSVSNFVGRKTIE